MPTRATTARPQRLQRVAARASADERRRDEAAQQRTLRALDASLQALQRLMSVGDLFGGVGGAAPRAALPPSLQPASAAARKRVAFRARATSRRQVPQARAKANKLQLQHARGRPLARARA